LVGEYLIAAIVALQQLLQCTIMMLCTFVNGFLKKTFAWDGKDVAAG